VNTGWEIMVGRLARALVWSAAAAVLVYELASHIFDWWVVSTTAPSDGQLGLGAWVVGLGAGALAALVAFCTSLYVSTFAAEKHSE
jgi:hypothetical protein